MYYRLYIDEVGNHDLKSSLDVNERFLTLFGIWIDLAHVTDTIQPEMSQIKLDFFQKDPDEPVIFHRKEISRFQGVFKRLYSDKDLRRRFGDRMLQGYEDWQYTAVAITIDKLEHLKKYQTWHYAPYHYCLEVLLERYILFLNHADAKGDVMIEARYKKVDRQLSSSFTRMHDNGTSYLSKEITQKVLSSRNIKLKKKKQNIEGLQLADLLAHPAHYDLLLDYGIVDRHESEYGVKVAKILNRSKFHRNPETGEIRGYGKKLLP